MQVGELKALLTIIILTLMIFSTIPPSLGTAQNDFPNSIFTFTTQAQPHELRLKAIQQDGQTSPLSEFTYDLTNVISTPINSELIMFTTDYTLSIMEAKVRTITDTQVDLAKTKTNTFSLVGLPVGVYTFDVIVQKQNSKAAYEGILVIGQTMTESTKQVVQKEIVNKKDDIRIVFEQKSKPDNKEIVCLYHPENPLCDPGINGKCRSGWGMNEDGNCFPANKKCSPGSARMDNDETGACILFNKIKYDEGCPPGSANLEDGCTLEGYHCTPDQGCGYYSHGVCETCVTRNIPMLTQALTNNNDVNTTTVGALVGDSGGGFKENGELPACDGSFQDCVNDRGYVCVAGSTEHECEIDEPEAEPEEPECAEGWHLGEEDSCQPNDPYDPALGLAAENDDYFYNDDEGDSGGGNDEGDSGGGNDEGDSGGDDGGDSGGDDGGDSGGDDGGDGWSPPSDGGSED